MSAYEKVLLRLPEVTGAFLPHSGFVQQGARSDVHFAALRSRRTAWSFGSCGDTVVTNEEIEFWMEVGKLTASIATPIVVVALGVLLLRRIEGIKDEVAKQSEFHKKWADQFFECCQRFMQTLERDLALLTVLSGLENKNEGFGAELQSEISRLHPKLSELELRIRRSVVFAPSEGRAVTEAARQCIALTGKLISSGNGKVDDIIEKMNEFNVASRKANAEMLGLNAAEQGAPADAKKRRG